MKILTLVKSIWVIIVNHWSHQDMFRSIESTECQVHKVSSLLLLYFKSSFVSFSVSMEDLAFEFKLSSFCFPTNSLSMSNFQCKYRVIFFSNWFWIVLEQKGKCMIFLSLQTTIKLFFVQIWRFFLYKVVLLLNLNIKSVLIWINLLFSLQLLQQLTELVISGNFMIFAQHLSKIHV